MPWLALLLGCLDRALTRAEETLANVTAKARIWEFVNRQPINDRRLIINCLLNGFEGHLTTSKYAKIAKCSADTALRDIRELLDRGVLVQNEGGGRSTSYRIARVDEITAT